MAIAPHLRTACRALALSAFAVPLLFASTLSAQALDKNKALKDGAEAYLAKDFTKAVENLAPLVKSATPQDPIENVLYSLGFSYFFLKQNDDAIKTFELYLQRYPEGPNAAEVHLCLGRLLIGVDGKIDAALDHLKKACVKREFVEEARFLAADAFIKKGDKEKAAQALEAAMKSKISGPSLMRASLQLVDLYISAEEPEKAVAMLRKIEDCSNYADVIVTVNHRFVQIGDKYLEDREYGPALMAYSSARPRNQVVAIQTERLEMMRRTKADLDKRIKDAEAAKKPLGKNIEDKATIAGLMIENTEKVLGEVKKLNDYDSTLQYRIARCYFNMERFWPACVAFEVVANENTSSKDAPFALFGAVVCQWKLNRPEAAAALCDVYMKRFPDGKNMEEVAEIKATVLLQKGDKENAIVFMDDYIKSNKASPLREKFLLQIANARFQSGQYDAAARDFDTLKSSFPNTENAEEVFYMRGLCDFFRNDYPATVKSFDAYEQQYPRGQFSADIRYRRGIILLALGKDDKTGATYDTLIKLMQDLLNDPAAQGYNGQIHTLLADALSAKGDNDGAATQYADAVRNANGDDNVLSYSLEQATTMLRGARRWNDLESLWQDFLNKNPKHPMALRGVAELSKLLSRSNKKDQARQMLSEYALRDIHNVRSEYVEMLLSQLAGLYAPGRSVKKDAPKPDLDALEASIDKDLQIPADAQTPVYKARLAFTKSELARMSRDQPRYEKHFAEIAATDPKDLGPILLAMVGQNLYDKQAYDKAIPVYIHLRDAFPNSGFSDAAPVGLGRIYLSRKEYPKAIKEFDFAIGKSAGFSMLKEATYGKAQALQGMRMNSEAKALYEQIVASKEWRGEEVAGSLFQLAEIAAEAGEKGVANAYFQRVYLSHGAFPQFAAKAYIRSAEMLALDGQHEASLNTYRELLKNPKFASLPEAEIARDRTKNR